MRVALLDKAATANSASTTLAAVYPELKDLLMAYQRAATPDARRFAAAYLALKSPGLRPFVTAGVGRTTEVGEIDSFRDNWWCAEPPATAAKKKPSAPPEFLKAHQPEASTEVAALLALGT